MKYSVMCGIVLATVVVSMICYTANMIQLHKTSMMRYAILAMFNLMCACMSICTLNHLSLSLIVKTLGLGN